MTTANPSQFSLFGALDDLYPRSRRRDPETSRQAAVDELQNILPRLAELLAAAGGDQRSATPKRVRR